MRIRASLCSGIVSEKHYKWLDMQVKSNPIDSFSGFAYEEGALTPARIFGG
jgi:hypothetical protein